MQRSASPGTKPSPIGHAQHTPLRTLPDLKKEGVYFGSHQGARGVAFQCAYMKSHGLGCPAAYSSAPRVSLAHSFTCSTYWLHSMQSALVPSTRTWLAAQAMGQA